MPRQVGQQRIIVGNHDLVRRASWRLPLPGSLYPQGDRIWLQGALDDREEALARLIEIDLLAQCPGEGLDRFDRLPIAQVVASLNASLYKHTHRIKYNRRGERCSDNKDMRYITRVDEQFKSCDCAVVNERKAGGEQEVGRRTTAKYVRNEAGKFEIVMLELHGGQVHQYRKKEEVNVVRTFCEKSQ